MNNRTSDLEAKPDTGTPNENLHSHTHIRHAIFITVHTYMVWLSSDCIVQSIFRVVSWAKSA